MSLPVVEQHYEAQARQQEAAALLVARQWRRMDPEDLDRSWAQIVARLSLIVASAQLGAARAGVGYVAGIVDVEPDAQVDPSAWAGVASDGRPLDSLLYSSVVHTKALIGTGRDPREAVVAGGDWLDMITRTQVADASRGASGAAITTRRQVGYVRYVSPPCCPRCSVLSGKYFKWNDGFLRHPRCDCRHVPAQGGQIPEGFTDDIPADQIRGLTKAERAAIDDGANVNQVINSRRGRTGMTTSEGTTRRGYASYVRREVARQRGEIAHETISRSGKLAARNVRRTKPRLTPESIYRVADSREEALRLLRVNGYVVGDIRRIAEEVA